MGTEEWAWGSGGLGYYPVEVLDEVCNRHARNPEGGFLRRLSLLNKPVVGIRPGKGDAREARCECPCKELEGLEFQMG